METREHHPANDANKGFSISLGSAWIILKQDYLKKMFKCFVLSVLCSKTKQLRIVLRHGIGPDFLEIHLLWETSRKKLKKAFCYQKLFRTFTVWINCSCDLKTFENSRPSTSNFKSFSWSLDQFFLTVGQNNFGNKIQFFCIFPMNLPTGQTFFPNFPKECSHFHQT